MIQSVEDVSVHQAGVVHLAARCVRMACLEKDAINSVSVKMGTVII